MEIQDTLVAESQALDNVHGGAELASASQLTGGDERVAGEVLCHKADDHAALESEKNHIRPHILST